MWTFKGQFTLLWEISKLEQRCQTLKVGLSRQAGLILHLFIFWVHTRCDQADTLGGYYPALKGINIFVSYLLPVGTKVQL